MDVFCWAEIAILYFIRSVQRQDCILLVVFFLLFLVVVDLEVSQLVGVLGRSNHAEPIAKVVLLQVLLRQELQVTLREWNGRGLKWKKNLLQNYKISKFFLLNKLLQQIRTLQTIEDILQTLYQSIYATKFRIIKGPRWWQSTDLI